jgi:hypothetical protein
LKPEEVPAGPVLLDTTAFSHLLRGGKIAEQIASLTADHELVVSYVTVGEVMAGAIHAGWNATKLAALELKLAGCAKVVGSERVPGSTDDSRLGVGATASREATTTSGSRHVLSLRTILSRS